QGDLMPARADGAYRRAVEALRELTAEAPSDEASADLLGQLLAERRDAREQLAGPRDAQVVSAAIQQDLSEDCRISESLVLTLRNAGRQTMSSVRVRAGVPSLDLAPALASVESLAALQEKEIVIPLGYAGNDALLSASRRVTANALITWEQGGQGFAAAYPFEAVLRDAPVRSPAQALACRTPAEDTLLAGLPDSLLEGRRPASPFAAGDFAGLLDALESARALSKDSGPSLPAAAGMRAALRSLGQDEAEWTVLTASLASALGLRASILWRSGRPLALVDTGTGLDAALEALPALDRFRNELAGISRDGTLWIPISGRVPVHSSHPGFRAMREGLELLQGAASPPADRADVTEAATVRNAPIPFPFVLPAPAPRLSPEDIAAEVTEALAPGA
ncbi:MAG TPA: hypothetical protein VFI08_09155, partial [Spirochaetia bacterium]|nr:hypothetical protein [Spirochaetia bacterium]